MSAVSLLRELHAAGIRIVRDGDQLVADVLPGVELAGYRSQIASNKQEILSALREQEAIEALCGQLDAGWDWLSVHPKHPEHDAFLERWLTKLRDYERLYTHHRGDVR